MVKVDLKRELSGYAARRDVFDDVVLPPRRYAVIDGSGDPNTSADYRDALATLFPFSFAVKFASKRGLGRDYVVGPLEALWWADDFTAFTSARDPSAWSWRAMMVVPDWIRDDQLDLATTAALEKDAPAIDRLRIDTLDEGRCIQTLHVGPYDDEGPVLAHLHDHVIPGKGLRMRGHHHEIYLGDPRRAAPEKLRTILRQPVTDAAGG